MPTTNTTNKRPFCNCKRLTMWKMTDEEAETYSSTAISFEKRLTTYSDSVGSNSTLLYGDGELLETVVTEGEGTLRLGIHHITDEERKDIYNEVDENGAVISTGDEYAPFMCVALMAVKRSGKVNLRKYFKVAFSKHEESVNQQENSGVSYSMPTLQGTYSKNTALGWKSARREVDPSTAEGKTIIENWFSQADYIGPTTTTTP